jgi:hypothetical protein
VGLVLVGMGLWVFNTLEVTPGPSPGRPGEVHAGS